MIGDSIRKLDFSNKTKSISTKITFNNKHKLLTGLLALIFVAGMASPAYASLIGDTIHFKISNLNGPFCEGDVVVVDPGVEVINCVSSVPLIDLNGDSIWFESRVFANGESITALEYEFTDLDWINSQGIITGIEFFGPNTLQMTVFTFGDHSVTISHDAFTLDCGQESSCLLEFHIDIDTDHPIGGTVGSLDTTSLLIAGAQANMGWWSIAMIGAVAIGAGIVFKVKSNKTNKETL